jgi:hypothetical protein
VSVTGPTEETPCVQAGLAAVAVAMTTVAMTALIKRCRSSLANDCLAITADPCLPHYATVAITPVTIRELRARGKPPS